MYALRHPWTLLVLFLFPLLTASQAQSAGTDPEGVRASWIDYDADGLLDLFVLGGPRGDELLANRGSDGFVDVTRDVGLAGNASLSALPHDFDRDGDVDLLLVSSGRRLRLFEALPGPAFQEATEARGLTSPLETSRALWIDFDRDGWDDLWVEGPGRAPELFRNEEGLAFAQVSLARSLDDLPARLPMTRGSAGEVVPDAAAEELAETAVVLAPASPGPRPEPATGTGTPATRSSASSRRTEARPDPLSALAPGDVSALQAATQCAAALRDDASVRECILGSSVPQLGMFYPLSAHLFVSRAGNVGVGTTAPQADLHVDGAARIETSADVHGPLELFDAVSRRTIGLYPEVGTGGAIRMYNDIGRETFTLDSDVSEAGYLSLFNGTGGASSLILDGGSNDDGADLIMKAGDGSVGVYLDGDADNNGGLLSVRNDSGVDTIRIVGDGGSTNAAGENSGKILMWDRIENVERIVLNARQNSLGTGGQFLMRADNGTTTVDLASDAATGPIFKLNESDGSRMMHVGGDILSLYNSAGTPMVSWNRQTGTKSAVVRTASHGERLLYVQESPEVWFEDFGSATLEDGSIRIALDPIYLETVTIDERHPMKVFVTLTAESPGVYVEKGRDHFVVRERDGGEGLATFDWRVVAKRRGLEEERFGLLPTESR